MKLSSKLVGVAAGMALLSGQVALAEDASCKKVHLAEVGWSDIAATTGMASVVFEGLGYKPVVTMASVPIVLAGVKKKQIDVFLGYWNPTMTHMIEPFVKAGEIKVLPTPNLVNAKYTLAVPDYLYAKGLKSFADIAKFGQFFFRTQRRRCSAPEVVDRQRLAQPRSHLFVGRAWRRKNAPASGCGLGFKRTRLGSGLDRLHQRSAAQF